MNDALGMTVIYRLEKLKHVMCSRFLAKFLALLVADFIKHFHACNVLHDQV